MTHTDTLRFDAVSVRFPGPEGPVDVVHDLSFEVAKGKCVVIVGESGSGKSMCCQAILGIVPAPGKVCGGGIHWQGADLLQATQAQWMRVRGGEIAMIFQDPTAALNPLMTVGQQIMDVVQAHRRCGRAEARARAAEVLRQVRFPDAERRMGRYPWELSGGLRQRVVIAMALSCGPKLIIADEATTNLDVSIQAQIIDLLRELRDALGLSIIFVTHDLGLAPEIGDDVLVMYAGHAVERGPVRQVLANPCHPYTIGLLRSAPTMRSRRTQPLRPIPGHTPRADEVARGAPFRSRCPVVVERVCDTLKPGWTSCGDGHAVACHRYERDGRRGVL
jgi:oligopeptide/dipeptide ABC transporter ATP-binding protein